jgi:adenylyl cyclase-associated protein
MPFLSTGGSFLENFEENLKGNGGKSAQEEVKKPNQEPKKEVKKEQEKIVKKKSPPSKVQRGKMWDISNYENETLEFGEKEIDLSTFFMITNWVKTNIIIKGKFNNVSMTNCKDCALVVDTVIASVEIIKGDEVKLQVNEKAPQVTIDRSNKTGIYLNDNSKDIKVNTTTSTVTYLHFPIKEPDINGNDEASVPIPETYVTTIKGDKVVTVPLDLTD